MLHSFCPKVHAWECAGRHEGAKLPLPGAAGALSFILLKGNLKGLRESRQEGPSARPAPQLPGRSGEYIWQPGIRSLCRRWGTGSPHWAGGGWEPEPGFFEWQLCQRDGAWLLSTSACPLHHPLWERPWYGWETSRLPGCQRLPAFLLQLPCSGMRPLSRYPIQPGPSRPPLFCLVFPVPGCLLIFFPPAEKFQGSELPSPPAPSGSLAQREHAGLEVRRPGDSHSICNNRKGGSRI